jgi:hypothetical protein
MEMLLFTKQNLEILVQLQKSFPNDFELGKEVRKRFKDNSYVRSLGNDQDLGREIRKVIKNYNQNNL